MFGIKDFDSEDLKKIAEIMDEKKLDRFELKYGDLELTLEKNSPAPPPPPTYPSAPFGFGGGNDVHQGPPPFMAFPPVQPDRMPATANKAAENSAPSVETQTAYNGNVVKSPIVGTYYAAPAPGKPPFVKVGQTVKKGDVIMIIESMKLMNEVQSDYDGVVSEIIAKDGQVVEYNQPIMIIK